MTTKNAEKRLAKMTGKEVETHYGQRSVRLDNGVIVSFRNNGRETETSEATCFHTRRETDLSDPMTDYFAGTFHDNLTKAVKFAMQY